MKYVNDTLLFYNWPIRVWSRHFTLHNDNAACLISEPYVLNILRSFMQAATNSTKDGEPELPINESSV